MQGESGAEFSDQLETRRIAAIFRKGMDPEVDSYSGFFDNNREHRTGMAGYLKDLGVTDIYLTGLAADFCVYYSAKDGRDLGFEVYYVTNATKAISAEGYEAAIKDLEELGVHMVEL